ncbi:MAG: pentapeptide repeat-containing protein [Chlorobiaceae bacterium]|nr:pentapeptide repeat-containing protein [Chlorobiaceae bacterium]
MADPKHLEIIKQGPEAWNDWFAKHSNITPDLKGADFSGMSLVEVRLSGANLAGAVFTHADLTLADLSMTDLSNADLRSASLVAADFRGTNLASANLRGADLQTAIFGFTDLAGTDFSDVSFGLTMLNFTDFSKAVGLNTVKHAKPSSIGVETILWSEGHLSDEFLRGCGVPKGLVEFFKNCAAAPSGYHGTLGPTTLTDLRNSSMN